MIKNFLKEEWNSLIVLLLPYVYLALIWNQLPDQIPSHFNIHGEIDGYSSKLFFPVFNLILYLFLIILPKFDPKSDNYKIFSGTYNKVRFLLITFFSAISVLVYTKALSPETPVFKYVMILLLILFMMLGNYMANLKQNWFIGIRTPWTMDNETVWRKTHLLTSRLWFFGSLGGIILILLANIKYAGAIVPLLIITLVVIPVLYSFIIFKKLQIKEQ